MTASLADSLDVILRDLPQELVPRAAHGPVRELATRLAPTARCGFEVRLAAGMEVDFHQAVAVGGAEREALRDHLARRPGADASHVRELLSRWIDGDLALEQLWLEFDRPPASSLSVFAGLTSATIPGAERAALAMEVLDLLGADEPGWRSGIQRVLDACRDGAFVSHLGAMLGRAAPFVRVNVKRLAPTGLGAFLEEIGWPGEREGAERLMRRLAGLSDRVTVCLDVGDRVGGLIGFECSLASQPPAESRWNALLDELVREALCTCGKREALLAWPGLVTPSTERLRWPAHLVATGMLHPPDHFSALERQLSHVKVTLGLDGAREAKGYFGYLHTWLRPAGEPEETRPRHERRRPRAPADRAVAYLSDIRTRAGWWNDFDSDVRTAIGPSDTWVSAYVATALASFAAAQPMAERVWALLVERQLPTGGWGYSRSVLADADSTAWALRLAAAIGRGDSAAALAARAFLGRHVLRDGAVTTYLEENLPPPAGDGWTRTGHADVAGAAAPVLSDAGPVLEWLRQTQASDGGWHAYWWKDREYATALAGEALARTGSTDDRARVKAAVEWANAHPAPESPFKLALQARIFALDSRYASERARTLAALIERQDPDGGWPASARLRIPRAEVTDPETAAPPAVRLDRARAFTTATALSALA